MEDVACSAAIALHADKLIFIAETPMMEDATGVEIRELSSHQAEAVLMAGFLPDATAFYLKHCVKACPARALQRASCTTLRKTWR